jgi:hypothetical protein
MKRCPVHGCDSTIRVADLCCHTHWRMISPELRGDYSWLRVNAKGSFEQSRVGAEAIEYLNALPADQRLSA